MRIYVRIMNYKTISKERKLNHNTDLTRTGIQHGRLGPTYDVITNRACDCISRTLDRVRFGREKNALPVFLTLSIRLYQHHHCQMKLEKRRIEFSSLGHVTFRVIEAIIHTLERLNQFSKPNFNAAQPFFRSL
jgi:hypothetical protein